MDTMALPTRTEIAVVAPALTGLTTAVTLAAAGVDYVIVDMLAEGANTSRAAVVRARTLEVLDELGAAEGVDRPRHSDQPVRRSRPPPPTAHPYVRRTAHPLPVHAGGSPRRD